MKTVTLIIPAYNEAASIEDTILEIDSHIPKNWDFTIFVSEDGSKDLTRELVMNTRTKVKNCTVTLSEQSGRLGYSKAVLRGIRDSKSEYICFMDADGQCDPKDLEKILNSVAPGKVVCGYRNPRADSTNRIIYSKLFGIAYRIFGGPKRIDPSSPFICAYKNDIDFLTGTEPKLSFGFWWEFQIRISKRYLEIIEIPISHRVRTAGVTQVYSMKKIPKIVWTHLIGLFKLNRELN
jgi:glycosyltransferase involved in cell wall biosynthesis